ncbi:uncharacterized protein [Argopecten irradians]
MRMYYLFLAFILESFKEFNITFQLLLFLLRALLFYSVVKADEFRIGYMAKEIRHLLGRFLGRFVKAKVIREADHFTKVEFDNINNQIPDSIVDIGPFCYAYIVDKEDSISPSLTNRILGSFRKFYCTVVDKMIKKFPFEDAVGLGTLTLLHGLMAHQ